MAESVQGSAAPRLSRRFTAICPRCQAEVELSLDWHTRLTYGAGGGTKGWLSVEVGASAIEHTCEADR